METLIRFVIIAVAIVVVPSLTLRYRGSGVLAFLGPGQVAFLLLNSGDLGRSRSSWFIVIAVLIFFLWWCVDIILQVRRASAAAADVPHQLGCKSPSDQT